MDLEFLRRMRKTSLISGLVLFPVVSTYFGWAHGASWLIGCVWSVLNIHFTGILVEAVVTYPKRSRTRIALISLAKFPALYAVGFLFLQSSVFSVPSLLAGFFWPLTVLLLKAIGRVVLGLDRGRKRDTDSVAWISRKGV